MIEAGSERTYRFLNCGTIRTPSDMSHPRRLQAIYQSVCELIESFEPDAVAVERLFFSKNVKTAFMVGQARGVILLAIEDSSGTMYEYTPLEVKKSLTGNGNSDKKSVQQAVQKELHLEQCPEPDDAADGLAIAICHDLKTSFQENISHSSDPST